MSVKDSFYPILRNTDATVRDAIRLLYDAVYALAGRKGVIRLEDAVQTASPIEAVNTKEPSPGELITKAYADAHYSNAAAASALSATGTNPLNVSTLPGYAAARFDYGATAIRPIRGSVDGQIFNDSTAGVIYRWNEDTETWVAITGSASTHPLLDGSVNNDTTASAVVSGDVIYGNATPKWTRLAKGSDGQVLTLAGGLPSWAAGGVSTHNLLSATHPDTTAAAVVAGDIIYGDATPKWVRLPKGTDGQILTLSAGLPGWATGGGGSGPWTSSGSYIYPVTLGNMVGIGTATPDTWSSIVGAGGENLQVYVGTGQSRVIINSAAGGNPELHLVNGANAANDRNYRLIVNSGDITLDQPSDDYSATQQLMTWTKSGSAVIGAAAPGANSRLALVGGGLTIGTTAFTEDAALHIGASYGGLDRLTQMNPTGASKPGLNLMASTDGGSSAQWWSWGVDTDNSWKIMPGTAFSGLQGALKITTDANLYPIINLLGGYTYTQGATITSTNSSGTAVPITFTSSSVLFPAGSVALPAIGFSGDPNTGMYSAGANIIGFTMDGGASQGARIFFEVDPTNTNSARIRLVESYTYTQAASIRAENSAGTAQGLLLDTTYVDTNTAYKVAGTQVVSARGAAVADATDAATVITQLNTLLARLRTHGIIAT